VEDFKTSRRGLIGAGLGTAAMAVVGTSAADGKSHSKKRRRYRENQRIDMHAHHVGPGYRAALGGAGINAIGGIPIPEWSPEAAIKFMDAHGIALQMLSVSDPGVDFLPTPDATALARSTNDYVAGVVKDHPKRFGAFGVVSLQDVQAARSEAARALDTLELDGIGLLSSNGGRYLGDPHFDALLADLDHRRAWVFVHPTAVSADDKPSYGIPDFIAEYPFDTTRTIISLLFNGVFDRHRNIRWQFAHGGGTIPMLRARLTVLAANAKQVGPLLGLPPGSSVLTEKSPRRALRASYVDTALIGDEPSLAAAAGTAEVKHLVFGSDWPFAARLYGPKGDPQPSLSKVLSNKERRRVDRLNARGQFKQLRPFIKGE
jgi:predicted TIM-barrel fold metal-dependent hydrolase